MESEIRLGPAAWSTPVRLKRSGVSGGWFCTSGIGEKLREGLEIDDALTSGVLFPGTGIPWEGCKIAAFSLPRVIFVGATTACCCDEAGVGNVIEGIAEVATCCGKG